MPEAVCGDSCKYDTIYFVRYNRDRGSQWFRLIYQCLAVDGVVRR